MLMHVHILLVQAGFNAVLLVDMGPRDFLPALYLGVVWSRAVLIHRLKLHRILILLLDLRLLWQ